jgi:hypothetical protein
MPRTFPIFALKDISTCYITEEGVIFLSNMFKGKPLELSLAYRASAHGWTVKEFHSRCDLVGPTLSLCQMKGYICIGGYARQSWLSTDKEVGKNDDKAKLFNINLQRMFPVSYGSSHSVTCSKNYGPIFGSGEFKVSPKNDGFVEGLRFESFADHQGCKGKYKILK